LGRRSNVESRERSTLGSRPSSCFARVAQCRGTTSRASPVQVQFLPRAPFWNVNRPSAPGLFAKQCAPRKGSVVRVHGIPPLVAPVAQLAERPPYTREAPDECKVGGSSPPRGTGSHFRSRSHSRPAPGFYPDTVRLQLPPAPPIQLRDGVRATRRSLKAKSMVRIHLPQPTPGGEIASRLAYTQKARGQNLPGRPFASLHSQQCAGL
jgi:hypothetical protein